MKRILWISIIILWAPVVHAQTSPAGIDPSRFMNWSVVGVPGGIPSINTICATLAPSPINPQTTTGTTIAGSNQLTAANIVDFNIGEGIDVAGAAFEPWTTTPGATLHSYITNIQGNVITLRDNAQVAVAGAAITHDDAAAFQSALNNCPANQVVYAPTGNYTLNWGVSETSHSGIVLRGDGPGKTVFTMTFNGTGFNFGDPDWPPPQSSIPILAGSTPNSSTITVDTTSSNSLHGAFVVGGFIKISAGTNPSFVKNIGASSYDLQLSMTFRVTSLTANTVTFTPPIPFDFSPYSPVAAIYQVRPISGIGLENFTINMNSIGGYGVQYQQLWGSWMNNIEIENSTSHVIALYAVLNSEVRHCYFHDTVNAGPDTEGLDFYRDSDWDLIEDNVIYKTGTGGIVVGDWEGGSSGNVIASNFVYGSTSGSNSVAGLDIDLNHGTNNILNLVEGNIAGDVYADGYFGSADYDMFLRNWFTATHPTATNNLYAIRMKHFSNYMTAIGNVLGTSAFPTSNHMNGNFAYGGFYDAPQSSGYDDGWSTGVQCIYETGFPNIGNTFYSGTVAAAVPIDYSSVTGTLVSTTQQLDLNVPSTLLRTGNYDYFNRSIIWDPNITDHTIPVSYVHSSKPAFMGSLGWPTIDPNSPPGTFNSTTASILPAAYRYFNPGQDTPGVGSSSDNITYGDINGDSHVTIADAEMTAQAAIGLITLTSTQQQAAEVDGTGRLNIYDAFLIAEYAVGVINTFPVQS
jgi:hypothetical protein